MKTYNRLTSDTTTDRRRVWTLIANTYHIEADKLTLRCPPILLKEQTWLGQACRHYYIQLRIACGQNSLEIFTQESDYVGNIPAKLVPQPIHTEDICTADWSDPKNVEQAVIKKSNHFRERGDFAALMAALSDEDAREMFAGETL